MQQEQDQPMHMGEDALKKVVMSNTLVVGYTMPTPYEEWLMSTSERHTQDGEA